LLHDDLINSTQRIRTGIGMIVVHDQRQTGELISTSSLRPAVLHRQETGGRMTRNHGQ
jgi:hypothetical protein